ncbi:MAG: MscL family protein [Acidimicrobiales bacterium]
MRNLLREFRTFAMSGNMIDLALGFIIGAAFAGLVESLAKNVITDFIAAVGGQPDTSGWTIGLGDGEIHIGAFIGDLLSFVILAAVLFGLVKLLMRAGIGNFRAQGSRECPYCRELVPVDAVRCKFCTSELVAVIDGDEGAEERVPAR